MLVKACQPLELVVVINLVMALTNSGVIMAVFLLFNLCCYLGDLMLQCTIWLTQQDLIICCDNEHHS